MTTAGKYVLQKEYLPLIVATIPKFITVYFKIVESQLLQLERTMISENENLVLA